MIRTPVNALKATNVEAVRDRVLREKLLNCTRGISDKDKAAWTVALATFTSNTGAHFLRLLLKNKSARKVEHGNGRFSRWLIPGNTHSITFWRMPDGTVAWRVLTVWDATKAASKPHENARKLFAIHKDDTLRIVHDNIEKTVRVKEINPSESNNNIVCVDVNSATDDDLIKIKFSRVIERSTRVLHVSPTGDVRDPGPPNIGKP